MIAVVSALSCSKVSPARAELLAPTLSMRPDLTLSQFSGVRLRPVEVVQSTADTPASILLHNPAA